MNSSSNRPLGWPHWYVKTSSPHAEVRRSETSSTKLPENGCYALNEQHQDKLTEMSIARQLIRCDISPCDRETSIKGVSEMELTPWVLLTRILVKVASLALSRARRAIPPSASPYGCTVCYPVLSISRRCKKVDKKSSFMQQRIIL